MKAASAMAARMAEAFQRNKIHPFPEMTAGTYTSSLSESARSSASPRRPRAASQRGGGEGDLRPSKVVEDNGSAAS